MGNSQHNIVGYIVHERQFRLKQDEYTVQQAVNYITLVDLKLCIRFALGFTKISIFSGPRGIFMKLYHYRKHKFMSQISKC